MRDDEFWCARCGLVYRVCPRPSFKNGPTIDVLLAQKRHVKECPATKPETYTDEEKR